MGVRWSVPLPGPFSVGGRVGGRKGSSKVVGVIALAVALCCCA